MENWATRLYSGTKHEPIYPSISQKIHWLPQVSFSAPRILQNIRGDGAFLNRGSASSSVVTPAPSAFVGSPLESPQLSSLLRFSAYLGFLKIASAPFERVKLLVQNQNAMIKSGRLSQPYNGICNCFATTVRTEGFFSLWRGSIAMATGTVSSRAISIALNEYFASHPHIHGHWNYVQKEAVNVLTAAGILFLVYPFLFAGTRMANDVKTTRHQQFNGIFDVYRKTLKSDGIAGLYRGYNLSLAHLGMATMASSALMPWQQHCYQVLQDNFWGLLAVSCGFRVCRNLAVYPLDTVSKRMMMTSGEAVKYKSSLNAFAQIFRTEGVKSFYRGAGADMLFNVALAGVQTSVIHLAAILIAAMEKPGDDDDDDDNDDDGGGYTFTITWKKPRGY